MVGERSYAKERNLLNAISSLKRAAGIPNGTTKDGPHDDFRHLEIFVPDYGSAEVLSNLLCQCFAEMRVKEAQHDGRNTNLSKELSFVYDTVGTTIDPVSVDKHGSEFRLILKLFHNEHVQLTEQIKRKTISLIAPDKNPRGLTKPKGYDGGW